MPEVGESIEDKGFHAPTTYFPLLVPECLLIEPTETESKQTLDAFVRAMAEILDEARTQPALVKAAPLINKIYIFPCVRRALRLYHYYTFKAMILCTWYVLLSVIIFCIGDTSIVHT